MNVSDRGRVFALFALVLFVPAPTVGVLLALHTQQGKRGSLPRNMTMPPALRLRHRKEENT